MQVHEQGKLNSPKHVADWLAAVGFDPPYCPSDVVMRMPDEHPDER